MHRPSLLGNCDALVRQLQETAVAVEQMCRVLEVSRSGYYVPRRGGRVQSAVCKASGHLKTRLPPVEAFRAAGVCARRWRPEGVVMGIYRLRRLMRQHGLRPV